MFPVEAFQATLEKTVSIFELLSLRYHLTGGITSGLYGEPRMTQDIDIVVDNDVLAAKLQQFFSLLDQADFLYSSEAVTSAVEQRGMFQVFDNEEALKLDIYPRELIAGELSRSCLVEVFAGRRLPVVSKVDAAGAKLVWISKGSSKSRRDFRQIYRTSSEAERQQIHETADGVGLRHLLEAVLAEPDEVG